MGFLNRHQHTAVTSTINDCCEKNDPSGDDFYIETQLSVLLDAIKFQKDFAEPGPVEAARALRKKMKYGNTKEQYNALRVLDLLITNGGREITALCNDDKLLDRLQFYLMDGSTSSFSSSAASPPNKKISNFTRSLMAGWYDKYRDDDRLTNITLLYERCMQGRKAKQRAAATSSYDRQVPDFMNDEADMDYTPFDDDGEDYSNGEEQSRYSYADEPSRYSTNSSSQSRPKTNAELDKKFKIPRINYDKEGPKIMQLIGQANIMATNLLNILNSLDKNELSIHSIRANDAFDECRAIRRKVLRYLQLVNREELLGPLLKCNDDLVISLKKYEEHSVPAEARVTTNSDSDDYDSLQDYESDHEPVNLPLGTARRAPISDDDYGTSDSDDDDRYVRERAPPAGTRYEVKERRAPPPVPAKKSVLQSPKPVKQTSIMKEKVSKSDYDPFSDDNEVAPVSWS